jgi:hypothetical protein
LWAYVPNPEGRAKRSLRQQAGNDLTILATIDAEIPIGGQDQGIRENLRHSDETCIGQTHWYVRVLLHESKHGIGISAKIEGHQHLRTPNERHERSHTRLEEIESLGENGLTRDPRRRQLRGLSYRPAVMVIAPVEQRNQKTGISDYVCVHRS